MRSTEEAIADVAVATAVDDDDDTDDTANAATAVGIVTIGLWSLGRVANSIGGGRNAGVAMAGLLWIRYDDAIDKPFAFAPFTVAGGEG